MKTKNKYLILEDSDHMFDLEVKKTKKEKIKYKLCRSKNDNWTNPGETVITAIDDGDGIMINNIKYEYDTFYELYLLISSIKLDQNGNWPSIEIKKVDV